MLCAHSDRLQNAGYAKERGSAGMCTVKPFAQGQRWPEMLGYIQKDAGKATYMLKTYNVTDAELTEVCCLIQHFNICIFKGQIETFALTICID